MSSTVISNPVSSSTAAPEWQQEIQKAANRVRLRVFEHVLKNGEGYISQACSAAEMLMLYGKVMKLGKSEAPLIPENFAGVPSQHNKTLSGARYNGPREAHLDRFIFSPAHYALVLYAVLIETGRLAPEALEMFNKDGGTVELIGAEHSPGVETTTGSLAQALSQAMGIALARRLKKDTGRTWVFMSDGELQEGQTWEAVQALSFHKVDNIAVFIDANGQQVDGAMKDVMNIEPLAGRLESFGARVFEVDGHDIDALYQPTTLKPDGRPLFVIARTDPARGILILQERAPLLHTLRFKSEDERKRYESYFETMKKEMGQP